MPILAFNHSVMVTLKYNIQHSLCHGKQLSNSLLIISAWKLNKPYSWCQKATRGLKQIMMWDLNPGADLTEFTHSAHKNKRVLSNTFHYHRPPPARNSNILHTEMKTLLQGCCHKELEMIENAQKNDLKVLEMGSRIPGVSRVHTFGAQK